ncbi:Bug family tripartite tricarboxylate transporter substrate binding protein [Cupriavidus pinatubonensis]|uniref:Bug family tripartite tricarboxylate transporter substrate binding protein n=1 Tax=Cupriavidus pinatubonensis TaxID=248026 RepID=UPI00112ADB96|nr:tripartite tricarboxylate transporter substrate binding protein [Cupriavidus pinatubonensis]TPQ39771.1 tripartite tricarboxylate transporter substrate binding protein [Cupriavidus pinatubonensis]
MRTVKALFSIFIFLMIGVTPAMAQNWPTRPVRIICPFPAGGGGDQFSRKLAEKLTTIWKQPVIVENKPGGGQIIGATTVVHANPDGYTLLLGTEASLQTNQFLFPKLPYSPARDFTPISRMVGNALVYVVRADSPYQSIQQLVAAAKANPGKISYGSAGVGSTVHILANWFSIVAGNVQFLHVPYQGAAPRIQALLAGQLDFTVTPLSDVVEMVKTNRLRVLATTADKRMKQLPNVATLTELGYRDSVYFNMFALVGPAKMQPELANKIANDTAMALKDPEFKAGFLDPKAFEVFADGPAAFSKFLASDFDKQKAHVKAASVSLD